MVPVIKKNCIKLSSGISRGYNHLLSLSLLEVLLD